MLLVSAYLASTSCDNPPAAPDMLSILTVAQFKASCGKVFSAVKIKARCTGTLEKLTYEGDQWRLLVSVEDSTGNMAVYFSNEARTSVTSLPVVAMPFRVCVLTDVGNVVKASKTV